MSSRFDARPSRRDLLKALPLAGALASCRSRPYARGDFTLPARSAVALATGSPLSRHSVTMKRHFPSGWCDTPPSNRRGVPG